MLAFRRCMGKSGSKRNLLFVEEGSRSSTQCYRPFLTTGLACAGHNKWSKTKHIKAVTDRKKVVERTHFAKQISLLSRMYGEQLDFNPQLANTVAAATKASIPKAIIEAAIARGQGRSLTGKQLQAITIEAIVPPNIAIIAEAETDNKIRTMSDLKVVLKKAGGVSSSSSFYFTRRGRVVLKVRNCPGPTLSEVLDASIESEGVEDVDEYPDAGFTVWTDATQLSQVTRFLADRFDLDIVESDIIQVPNVDTMVSLNSSASADTLGELVSGFAEYPEVKAIYVNARQGSVADEDWERVERHISV